MPVEAVKFGNPTRQRGAARFLAYASGFHVRRLSDTTILQ